MRRHFRLPRTCGWLGTGVAWFVLQNLLLSFVFVYGLAGLDHHIAERIPTHRHVAEDGRPTLQHQHGFQHVHEHSHGSLLVRGLDQTSVAVESATPSVFSQVWSGDLGPVDVQSVLLGGILAVMAALASVMVPQLLRPPLLRPPAGLSAAL